jgi:hypothetical protein
VPVKGFSTNSILLLRRVAQRTSTRWRKDSYLL